MPVHQNRSVGRVLSILELLGTTNKALTLTEIARSDDLDASTTYRAPDRSQQAIRAKR